MSHVSRKKSCESWGVLKSLRGWQVAGVIVSLLYVDSAGRRPLMVWGGAGCAAALVLMSLANHLKSYGFILATMCAFLFAFSASYGVKPPLCAKINACESLIRCD